MRTMHVIILTALAALVLTTATATAQDDLILLDQHEDEAVDDAPTDGANPWAWLDELKARREADWPTHDQVLAKIRTTNVLTRAEFIVYLRAIEASNPDKGWQQIITKLHTESYPADAVCVVAGVPLFVNGAENAGWEDVTLPAGNVPKFVVDGAGERVDVAHAYAGIRAGLNRSGPSRWAMTNVNTGWGDGLQVANARIGAVKSYLAGAFTFDYSKTSRAMDAFGDAGNFKPRDQVLGNELGKAVQRTLRDNPVPMSVAFDSLMQ